MYETDLEAVQASEGMKILEKHKDSFGAAYIAKVKSDEIQDRQSYKEVQSLLSLIALFGVILTAVIFSIFKYVQDENERAQKIKDALSAAKDPEATSGKASSMQLKNLKETSQAVLINKFTKMQQKATTSRKNKEEGIKLIGAASVEAASSSRASTAAKIADPAISSRP